MDRQLFNNFEAVDKIEFLGRVHRRVNEICCGPVFATYGHGLESNRVKFLDRFNLGNYVLNALASGIDIVRTRCLSKTCTHRESIAVAVGVNECGIDVNGKRFRFDSIPIEANGIIGSNASERSDCKEVFFQPSPPRDSLPPIPLRPEGLGGLETSSPGKAGKKWRA